MVGIFDFPGGEAKKEMRTGSSAKTKSRSYTAPKQARSQASLDRLLTATADVISKYGIEGATVGNIAKAAQLSSTVVYRRFRDKSQLMEAVFRHVMDTQERMLDQLTDEQLLRGLPLAEFVAATFRSLVIAYRNRGKFLAATRQFAHSHGSRLFLKRVERFETQGYRHAIALILERRNEIGHSEPEKAVAVGLLAVIGAVRERSNWNSSEWGELFPNDDELIAQLTTLFLTYVKHAPLRKTV